MRSLERNTVAADIEVPSYCKGHRGGLYAHRRGKDPSLDCHGRLSHKSPPAESSDRWPSAGPLPVVPDSPEIAVPPSSLASAIPLRLAAGREWAARLPFPIELGPYRLAIELRPSETMLDRRRLA